MSLQLHNSQTGIVSSVELRDRFTMYVCGPTVYDRPHIGNARPAIVFDVLMRIIEQISPNTKLIYASNITDVDDKIIVRAEELGISISDLTHQTTEHYLTCLKGLGNNPPTIQPRATQSIVEMIRMIEGLIMRGYAYEAEGHVLFDISKSVPVFRQGDNDYSRIEPVNYKRNQGDFVLWKPEWKGVGWPSPWGNGRPGWHIECSAMIHEHLGDTIDIHGGGQDLIFPHHEAECQQSHAMTGKPLARLWMHVGMAMIDGRKMSKSDGNFVTIEEVLALPQGGEALRMSMLMTHYRQPYDFTKRRINDAQGILNGLFDRADGYGKVDQEFLDALTNDLNTPVAIQRLANMDRADILPSLAILGIKPKIDARLNDEELRLFEMRIRARQKRDWAASDQLREELSQRGIVIKDMGQETRWQRYRKPVYS